jgi:hypothetical protein
MLKTLTMTHQHSGRKSRSFHHSTPYEARKLNTQRPSQDSAKEFTLYNVKSRENKQTKLIKNIKPKNIDTQLSVNTCVRKLETSLKELENSAVVYLNTTLRESTNL